MGQSDRFQAELEELTRKWSQLTAVPDAPLSTMQVIEYQLGARRRAEEYVNRLLHYFLKPDRPHGMGNDFLRKFLIEVPIDFDFDPTTYDLSDIDVQQQRPISTRVEQDGNLVPVNRGRLDLLISEPEEWFLIVELKFNAPDDGQTEFYCDATHVDDIGKQEYDAGEYYLFLHRRDRPTADGDCFGNFTWNSFRENLLEPFIADHGVRYPSRTTAQLRELNDDIKAITGMDEQQARNREKEELFIEHYETIKDVTDAFETRWSQFSDEWAWKLAQSLDENGKAKAFVDSLPAEILSSIPEDEEELFAAVDISIDAEQADLWTFRGVQDDWSHLFKRGWWRAENDLSTPIHDRADGPDIRIGFIHRLGRNRDEVLRDHRLKFYFRNMGANPNAFYDEFVECMDQRRTEITELLPRATDWTGNKGNRLEAVYTFSPEEYDSIYDAYVSTLNRAFTEHVIENSELIEVLDALYYEAIENVYDEDLTG